MRGRKGHCAPTSLAYPVAADSTSAHLPPGLQLETDQQPISDRAAALLDGGTEACTQPGENIDAGDGVCPAVTLTPIVVAELVIHQDVAGLDRVGRDTCLAAAVRA